jgi:hypothetical protein
LCWLGRCSTTWSHTCSSHSTIFESFFSSCCCHSYFGYHTRLSLKKKILVLEYLLQDI